MRRCFLLSGLCLGLLACQASYMDPYEGKADNDRDFKQEGFVSTLFSYLVVGDLNDEANDPSQTPPRYRESPACAVDHQVDWALLDQVQQQLRQQFSPQQLALTHRDTALIGQFQFDQYNAADQEHINADQYPLWDRLVVVLQSFQRIKIELIGRAPTPGLAGEPLAQERAAHMQRYLNKRGLPAYQTRSLGVVTQGDGSEQSQRLTFLLCTI